MAVTIIREIRNNASSDATVVNMAKPGDTAGRGEFSPGRSHELGDIKLEIPWCEDGQEFQQRHIRVDVVGRRFAIWQAKHDGADRVRVSTDSAWHKPGDVIGGFAAVGLKKEKKRRRRGRNKRKKKGGGG